MIGRLRGELIQKLPNLALVECGGVGYAAAISLSTYGLLPEVGTTVVLNTELLVRENEIALLADVHLLLGRQPADEGRRRRA